MSNNALLLSRRAAAVPQGVATATPLFATRAENAEIWDADGSRYIDLRAASRCSTSGIAIRA
ncbi:hypothetical protein [Sphingopyxis terrae]|uniref:hypothetical protein n=1 Tax=Sphingopyxis terrae TaxID=33052 RepID=UPI003638C5F5